MADAWLLAGVLAIEDSSSSGSTWNRPAQCSPWSHHATTSSTNWVARSSARGHHGGPCASALQDFAPGPGTMVAHGRSIVVAKSWIAAASRLGRSVVSWERRVRHGRRKAVTAGAAGARSRLRKSQSNLPLGFTGNRFRTVLEEGGREGCQQRLDPPATIARILGSFGDLGLSSDVRAAVCLANDGGVV